MIQHTDPDLLTIRRGLRLLRELNPEAFAHHARGLALLLRPRAEDGTPPAAAARRISEQLERLYPFLGFGETGR